MKQKMAGHNEAGESTLVTGDSPRKILSPLFSLPFWRPVQWPGAWLMTATGEKGMTIIWTIIRAMVRGTEMTIGTTAATITGVRVIVTIIIDPFE